ncbi:MAG: hypothetical protein IT375_28360 [Polyangiaceae bacterium]|nr:hypothetical protein [Polyangiaceae bacterium]
MTRAIPRLSRRSLLRSAAVEALAVAGLSACDSCRSSSKQEVVVCTSVDQVFSEPVFRSFEQASGVRVRAVYDTEETKSTGVLNRLIAEAQNPQADVFWSGDPVRPFQLVKRGLVEPYISPNAAGLPASARAADGTWTGFAARARILLVNKARVPVAPSEFAARSASGRPGHGNSAGASDAEILCPPAEWKSCQRPGRRAYVPHVKFVIGKLDDERLFNSPTSQETRSAENMTLIAISEIDLARGPTLLSAGYRWPRGPKLFTLGTACAMAFEGSTQVAYPLLINARNFISLSDNLSSPDAEPGAIFKRVHADISDAYDHLVQDKYFAPADATCSIILAGWSWRLRAPGRFQPESACGGVRTGDAVDATRRGRGHGVE